MYVYFSDFPNAGLMLFIYRYLIFSMKVYSQKISSAMQLRQESGFLKASRNIVFLLYSAGQKAFQAYSRLQVTLILTTSMLLQKILQRKTISSRCLITGLNILLFSTNSVDTTDKNKKIHEHNMFSISMIMIHIHVCLI